MLLIDQDKIYVKDYKDIVFMDSHIFRIQMNKYQLIIKGDELEIAYYDYQEIRLNGHVKVIEYENRIWLL